MHLYAALMTASICVVSVMTQKNNYGVNRALVLVRPMRLFGGSEFNRPTFLKRRKHTDDGKSPYKYEAGLMSALISNVYFFCPPDNSTKLLFKNKNANCQFPIRTKFTDGGHKLFNDRWWWLISNEYLYTNQEIEKHEELQYKSGAEDLTHSYSDSVYGFLYNDEDKRIFYVQYTIYSRNLLDSDVTFAQENDFITEPISLIEEESFQSVEAGLNYMKNEMKHFPLEGEETLNQIYDYYRATLASRFHFPFVQYKRPLFHYSNITLVHKDILDVFVKTQKFISEIKMDELRIFAVPYFHSENKDTVKDGNEKSREKYAPDIIGYLIFDKEEKQGIAIILHNESKSDENNVTYHCRITECESYHEYLKKKKVDENMFCYAYCCNINSILSEWKLDAPFSRSNQQFDDLNIQV